MERGKRNSVNLGWLGNLERGVMFWLKDRLENRLMRRYGGIQSCPWCLQIVQEYQHSVFSTTEDVSVDALHCGNCGGVSRWRFEFGMLPLDPIGLTAPPVKLSQQPVSFKTLRAFFSKFLIHKKRGSFYGVLGTGRIQIEPGTVVADYDEFVIYMDANNQFWLRKPEEMGDGRFGDTSDKVVDNYLFAKGKLIDEVSERMLKEDTLRKESKVLADEKNSLLYALNDKQLTARKSASGDVPE